MRAKAKQLSPVDQNGLLRRFTPPTTSSVSLLFHRFFLSGFSLRGFFSGLFGAFLGWLFGGFLGGLFLRGGGFRRLLLRKRFLGRGFLRGRLLGGWSSEGQRMLDLHPLNDLAGIQDVDFIVGVSGRFLLEREFLEPGDVTVNSALAMDHEIEQQDLRIDPGWRVLSQFRRRA